MIDFNNIICKFSSIELDLTNELKRWLNDVLPKLSYNWWRYFVLSSLTNLQYSQVEKNNIKTLDELDLASLLTVVVRSWNKISSKVFLNYKYKENYEDMREIRNYWAHITNNKINKEKILKDLTVINRLYEALDTNSEIQKKLDDFIKEIESIKEDIQNEVKEDAVEKKVEKIEENAINIGDVIELISDSSKYGPVMSINGNEYNVWIDGKSISLFPEQFKKQQKISYKNVSLRQLRASLTAHEILNMSQNNLYSLKASKIDFVPYQFRPAIKIIKSDIPNILVADDVGVGKTIEAGIILKELEARYDDFNSVLIICPKPLIVEHKWKNEMKRFDEDFEELDGKAFDSIRQENNRDGAWSDNKMKCIIPFSIFNEKTVEGCIDGNKVNDYGIVDLDPLPQFDLVIVDEAHHIRNVDTYANEAVAKLCSNAKAVVFLSATPLQNGSEDLYNLLRILRPDVIEDWDTFESLIEPNKYINEMLRYVKTQCTNWQKLFKESMNNMLETEYGKNVISHNSKLNVIKKLVNKNQLLREEKIELISLIEDLHTLSNIINRTKRKEIEDSFCKRRSETIEVDFTSEQREIYDKIIEFNSSVLLLKYPPQMIAFMIYNIMRQASSCLYGLIPFIDDFTSGKIAQINIDLGEDSEVSEQINTEVINNIVTLKDELLIKINNINGDDPKFEKLYEIINQKQTEQNNKVIVFSSFRHTLNYLYAKLKEKGIRVAQINGGVPEEIRRQNSEKFRLDKQNESAIDVLLFTEVGCEGLDYQFCDTMINYDIPWNPMRIEQRIGRIDRRGQKSETVKIHNIVVSDTIDAMIFNKCLTKIGVFEESIGDCSVILGELNNEISKIMYNPTLTKSEQQEKINQLADNKVKLISEMRKLENEQKNLYGIDLSNEMIEEKVNNSENTWISSKCMHDMLTLYLEEKLGNGEFLLGNDNKKTLRLSKENKNVLLNDTRNNFKDYELKRNISGRKWKNYLQESDKEHITMSFTYDTQTAIEDNQLTLLTQSHPLIKIASISQDKVFDCEIGVEYPTNEIEQGEYPFVLYNWDYKSFRSNNMLVAVCKNKKIQDNINEILQLGQEFDITTYANINYQELLDEHRKMWQDKKLVFTEEIKNDNDLKIQDYNLKKNRAKIRYEKKIQGIYDEKILRMREAEYNNICSRFEKEIDRCNEAKNKVDILQTLLVKGIIRIVPDKINN